MSLNITLKYSISSLARCSGTIKLNLYIVLPKNRKCLRINLKKGFEK